MPSSRAALAAVPVLITGATGTLAWMLSDHVPAALLTAFGALLAVCSALFTALPRLVDVVMRWRANESVLQENRMRIDVARRLVQQDDPQVLLQLLAQLLPPGAPFAAPSLPSEGPAPPG